MSVTYGLNPNGQTTLVGGTSNVNKCLPPPRDFFGTLNNFYLTNIYSIRIGDRYNGKTRYSRTDRTRDDVTMV